VSRRDRQGPTLGWPTRELALGALLAGLIVAAKYSLRLPIEIPGHTGVFWMAIMVVARGVIPRKGAGTVIGFVAGVLAMAFVPGREGILLWMKYVAPGVVLDLLSPTGARMKSVPYATLAASLANLAKLGTSYVLGLALGIPAGYLALGLGPSAISHAFFGAIGGMLGALVLRRLPLQYLSGRLEPQPPTEPAGQLAEPSEESAP
jgi:hypothetical protein